MDKVKTRTGKEFNSDYLVTIPYPEQAYIRIMAPLSIVASVFSDKNETAQIWYGETYLANYSHLVAIIPEDDAIKVCLAKE